MTPERSANITRVLNLRQPDLALVLEDIEDPHNAFAVMRTADAVGIQDVYLINTGPRKHKKFGKASSSSATKWLTLHRFDNVEECMEVVKARYSRVLASNLGDGAVPFNEVDFTQSMALVFSNERDGVSKKMLTYVDGSFVIPQVGMIQSLNISVACAVTLYEARRQRMEKGMYDGIPRLSPDEVSVLSEKWHLHKKQVKE